MIELIIADRCNQCNACVEACPTGVLTKVEGKVPVIAVQQDCQTCFMCELYCPQDAIYVAPDCDRPVAVVEADILASGVLGEFRRHHGWDEWAGIYPNDHWRMEDVFLRARDMAIAAARQ